MVAFFQMRLEGTLKSLNLDEFPKKKNSKWALPHPLLPLIFTLKGKRNLQQFFDRNWPRPILRGEIKNQYFFSEKKIHRKSQIVKYRWTAHINDLLVQDYIRFQNKTQEIPRIHKLHRFCRALIFIWVGLGRTCMYVLDISEIYSIDWLIDWC